MKCLVLLVVIISAVMKASFALRSPARYFTKARLEPKVVVVVGGGAAGYFSAVECARTLQENKLPYKVVVLEAGRSVLSKVLISGGGRCNVMHNPAKPPGEIAKGYPRGSKELLGPLSAKFGPEDTYEWFTSRGVELKTERDGRVFPTTDKSSTIANTLEAAARSANVEVISGAKVVGVDGSEHSISIDKTPASTDGNKRFTVTYQSFIGGAEAGGTGATEGRVLKSKRSSLYEGLESLTDEEMDPAEVEGASSGGGVASRREKATHSIPCDRVIMATGSSRLGYDMVRAMGHTMHDPLPSLFSFKIPDPELTALSGLSAKYTKISLIVPKAETVPATAATENSGVSTSPIETEQQSIPSGAETKADKKTKKKKANVTTVASTGLVQRGPLLLTRQGMSGPAVLKLSAFGARLMNAANYKFDVEVSWAGDLTTQQLVQHFMNEKKYHPNRLLSKCFPHLTDELMTELKEKMNAATVVPNMLRADIAHKRYQEYQHSEQDSNNNSNKNGKNSGIIGVEGEEADLSHYDVPEGQRLAAQQAETEDNLIPRRLWLYLLRRQGVEQLKWCQLSAQATQRLAEEVTKGVHRVEGRGLYRDEFVTCGGVNLKEVHFGTMESRVRPGLYLAGEVLDVDGVTGGYNFQSAWTTGHIAGSQCARSLLMR